MPDKSLRTVRDKIKFLRTHLPSGTTRVGEFNHTHHHHWAYPEGVSFETLRAASQAIVDKWNAAPQRDVWRYKLLIEE